MQFEKREITHWRILRVFHCGSQRIKAVTLYYDHSELGDPEYFLYTLGVTILLT